MVYSLLKRSNLMTTVFGDDLAAIEAEWAEEGIEPKYGSVENDLLVQHWENIGDSPVEIFRKKGCYDKFRKIVANYRASGTYYLDFDYRIAIPKPGDLVWNQVSSWSTSYRPEILTYKLVCDNVRGIKLADILILGEHSMKVQSRSGNLIEVTILNSPACD